MKLHQKRFCPVLCGAWVRLCKEWVIKNRKRRVKCRSCIENAISNSLICKTARWHLPDSRAVDKNRALTLFRMSAARVCPVLLVLSAFSLRSSSSSPSNLHSEVLAVLPPLLLISRTAGRWRHLVQDVPDKWRSRPLLLGGGGGLELRGG